VARGAFTLCTRARARGGDKGRRRKSEGAAHLPASSPFPPGSPPLGGPAGPSPTLSEHTPDRPRAGLAALKHGGHEQHAQTPLKNPPKPKTQNNNNRYLAANQAQACLSKDPQLTVTIFDPKKGIIDAPANTPDVAIGVRVANCGQTCAAKAQALSTLMTPWAKQNKVGLTVVMGTQALPPYQPGKVPQGQAAADMAASALTGNAIFARVAKVGGTPAPPMPGSDGTNIGARNVVEFAPVVVQYQSGSLADAYGRTTQVAADACAEVFGIAGAAPPGGRVPAGTTGLAATTAKV
jgi:hypothetical protein